MADAPRNGWPRELDGFAEAAGFSSWADWIAHLEVTSKDGKPLKHPRKICGRWVKGSGGRTAKATPCCRLAGAPSPKGKPTGRNGSGACGAHGGNARAGSAHPAYKDGRRSLYNLQGRLSSIEERLDESQELDAFELREDALVRTALMIEALDSLPEEAPTPAALRRGIERLRQAADLAIRSGDPTIMLKAAEEFLPSLDETRLYIGQVARWLQLSEHKRKLVETHMRKRAREYGPVLWQDVMEIVEELRAIMARIINEFVPAEQRSEAIKKLRTLTLTDEGGKLEHVMK